MVKDNHLNKLFTYFSFVLMQALWLLFYFVEPLRRLVGDSGTTLRDSGLFFLVVMILLILLLLYIFVYELGLRFISFRKLFIYFILFNLVLLFIWPIGSTDLFSYIYQSRVVSEHHLNPYVHAYGGLTSDAFFPLINNMWSGLTSLYGPLFLFITSILTFMGGIIFH